MKIPYKLLAIALLTLSLSCCRRDDDQPMQHHTLLLPQEVKDYLLFKPGTYWVYQNNKTQELDSVYVVSVDTAIYNTIDEENNISLDYEYFHLRTYSNYEQYYTNYFMWVPFATNAIKSTYRHTIKRDRTKPGDFVGETFFFVSSNEIGNIGYQNGSGGTLILLDKKDTLLNSNPFSDVYIYENNIDVSENHNHTKYYIAKNFGIIKKEFVNKGEAWELIRYNIVKE